MTIFAQRKTMTMKKRILSELPDYLTIMFGVMVYSFAAAFFILPYKLSSGGVTGIGLLIFYATGLEVQNTVLAINTVLLIIAIKELGFKFCVKTIFATLSLSFFLWLAQRAYEWAGSPMPVGDEMFMACMIAAVFQGLGLAICFRAGGSTGGTDIVAAIVNKYRNMSLGTVIMIIDIVIISCCYFVFHDIQRVVFGYVLLIVASFTIDYLMTRSQQSVEFKIYSRNPQPIADALTESSHGVTILNGMGNYTKSERKVIITVVHRSERQYIFRLIMSIDPYAFVTMGNVSGVWGEGFDTMKVSKKNSPQPHIIVLATNQENELDEARALFGEGYEVRSLSGIGCDVNNPLNLDIQSHDAGLRARCIKYYYGYDCLAAGSTEDGASEVVLAMGKAAADDTQIYRFGTLAEVKAFLDATKNKKPKK